MKRTILLASVAACLFTLNANAAETKFYVGAKALHTDLDADMKWSDVADSESYDVSDKGWGAALSVGASIKLPSGAVRTELEYSKKADAESSYESYGETFKTEFETQSLMLNAYYDIDTGTRVTPYVGGGIGYAKVKLKDQYWKDVNGKTIDDNNFAWQLGAGIAVAVTDNVSVDAGYRYIDYGDMSESVNDVYGGESESIDLSANEFYLGARYTF